MAPARLQDERKPDPPREVFLINELIRDYMEFQGYKHSLSVFLPGADRLAAALHLGVGAVDRASRRSSLTPRTCHEQPRRNRAARPPMRHIVAGPRAECASQSSSVCGYVRFLSCLRFHQS